MDAKGTLIPVALALSLFLTGCATAAPGPEPTPEPAPISEPAAGLRLAPGLYDQADGTVLAIGTLEYQDLEGGFWAVIGGTESEGNLGEIVAVIANAQDFAAELEALEGATVDVTGTRLEGASIRMAGPEIEISTIEEISDTGGIAE